MDGVIHLLDSQLTKAFVDVVFQLQNSIVEKRYGHSHKEEQNSSHCEKVSKVSHLADHFTVLARDPLAFCPPVSFFILLSRGRWGKGEKDFKKCALGDSHVTIFQCIGICFGDAGESCSYPSQ